MTAPVRRSALGVLAVLGLASACEAEGPAPVTLRAGPGGDVGLRLADGVIVPSGEADVSFHHAMVMSLRAPAPASLCRLGTFATLADIPAPDEGCTAAPAGWTEYVYLDACSTHTLGESSSRGLGIVVRDRERQAPYRVRIVGDAYDPEDGAAVVLEYEAQR